MKTKYYLINILILVILDQIIKNLIIYFMIPYEIKEIFPFFSIYYTINQGIAFSILSSFNETLIIVGNFFAILFVFLFLKFKEKEYLENYAYIFILGGAIGNFIDRIRFYHVIDYMFFYTKNFYFAVFNLADIFITIGAIILIKVEILQWYKNK